MTWNPSTEGPPSREVQQLLAERRFHSVLDAGCGWGRNLIPFIGYTGVIHGFDLDAEAVERAAARLGTGKEVRIWKDDVRDASITEHYELVMCVGVLHFLPMRDRLRCYQKLKQWVKPGGFTVVVLFNAKTDIPPDLVELMPEVPADSGEILSAFDDWCTINHQSYTYNDEHDNGRIKHVHSIDRLITRRPVD